MNVKITTAGYEVINSGLVTAFNNEPICIQLPNEAGKPFKLSFCFLKDKSITDHRMEAEAPNNNEVVVKLINFNNPLGTGTIRPVHFASSNGKKLYVNFYVYVVGESSSTLHYTIYKEI